MKQVVINIPDNKYLAFLRHVKSKFSDIQIKENDAETILEVSDDSGDYETMLLSEKSLSEDWLSDDDNRWGEVL